MVNFGSDERSSFDALRHSLRQDLTIWHGFSNPDTGAILNWFSPSNPEYLNHVDDWQVSLCQGAVESAPPFLPYHRNGFGSYDIFSMSGDQVVAIHQVAKLLYKWHGIPRKETNMDEVKLRLRQPLPITLRPFELEGIRECLRDIRPPDLNEVLGRFGPGATFEGFNSEQKWKRVGGIPDVPPNLFRVNPRDPKEFRPFGDGVTKIAEVPKSIKCNRIVSSEPAMYMFAQLAVADNLVKQLHQYYGSHVSLDDQERHNRALMWDGACSIDLSDASDHVSCELVRSVLPQLWPVLAKVRSSSARFPDGEEVPLGTFAPMGSGCCFPVLTTVTLGIVAYAAVVYRLEGGRRAIWYHIYGDDLIVPLWLYEIVCDLLTRAGLLVNRRKSCCNLLYRESCGKELFGCVDVTPAYIRDPFRSLDAAKVEQICSHLESRFFPNTAKAIADLSEAALFTRYNRNLQRLEVCVRATSARQKIHSISVWDGLLRWFATRTLGNSAWDKRPTGVCNEVWTAPSHRLRDCAEYPYLTSWLISRTA